jgi:hypothetical protein
MCVPGHRRGDCDVCDCSGNQCVMVISFFLFFLFLIAGIGSIKGEKVQTSECENGKSLCCIMSPGSIVKNNTMLDMVCLNYDELKCPTVVPSGGIVMEKYSILLGPVNLNWQLDHFQLYCLKDQKILPVNRNMSVVKVKEYSKAVIILLFSISFISSIVFVFAAIRIGMNVNRMNAHSQV